MFLEFVFVKQKAAFEMLMCDLSSEVCSSDRPDPGHDPDFNVSFANDNLSVHGIHVRNLRMSGDQAYYSWRFNDPGSTGINGTGRFNKIAFTGNRIGKGYATGGSTDAAILAGYGPAFIACGHEIGRAHV